MTKEKFNENELDYMLSIADAFNKGSTKMYMTSGSFHILAAETKGIYYNGKQVKYKNHTVIIDENINNNSVIKMSSEERDFYYTWSQFYH